MSNSDKITISWHGGHKDMRVYHREHNRNEAKVILLHIINERFLEFLRKNGYDESTLKFSVDKFEHRKFKKD